MDEPGRDFVPILLEEIKGAEEELVAEVAAGVVGIGYRMTQACEVVVDFSEWQR